MQQPTTPLTRSRTVSWEDPLASAQRGSELSGLDYLKAMMAGELPPAPMAVTLGMLPIEVEDGRAVFAAEPAEYHYNPIGVVHGGLAATMLDSATGCAVQTTLPAGVGYTTLELKTNFVRAITRDTGRILCEAEVVHRGGTIATAEGRLRAEATGKLLAHGTSTCLIIHANGNGNGRQA
jgi:uncharacterized protein (TIGR00369 family)